MFYRLKEIMSLHLEARNTNNVMWESIRMKRENLLAKSVLMENFRTKRGNPSVKAVMLGHFKIN